VIEAPHHEKGGEVVNFPGCIITPPFCDYHLHFSADKLMQTQSVVRQLHTHGIMKAYEGGEKNLSGLSLKRDLQGIVDIKTSGYAFYKVGSYGKAIGKGIRDVSDAKELIKQLHSLDVDYIKIINSGIFIPRDGAISQGGFKKDEIVEIILFAGDNGLPAVCHANGDRAVRDAVLAGASAIVHGFSISDDTLSLMSEKKVDLIPTVNALSHLSEICSSPAERMAIEKATDAHLALICRAKEKGVSVLPGSDSGPSFLPYGKAYKEELEMFARAGFSLEETLKQAVAGQLEIGKRAGFLIVRGFEVKRIFVGYEERVVPGVSFPDP
jgi:imidazolonepropionase-like amidohydrolase